MGIGLYFSGVRQLQYYFTFCALAGAALMGIHIWITSFDDVLRKDLFGPEVLMRTTTGSLAALTDRTRRGAKAQYAASAAGTHSSLAPSHAEHAHCAGARTHTAPPHTQAPGARAERTRVKPYCAAQRRQHTRRHVAGTH